LVVASYIAEGAKGVLKTVEPTGGKREAFYFAFGDHDVYAIMDAPDHATVAAASLAINASGAVRTKTVVLLMPGEIDQAIKKGTTYQPPGR
jgi:uncharacterized protein with GYD domain